MATYTSYLNLEKPTTSETFNLLKMNQNWDKIDAGVSALNSKIANFTVYDMERIDTSENDAPWLIIKRLFTSMPTGILVGTISCSGYRGYWGYKINDKYGAFIVDLYNTSIPTYRVVVSNGVVGYAPITTGSFINA